MATKKSEIFLKDNSSDSHGLNGEVYKCNDRGEDTCAYFNYQETDSNVQRYNYEKGDMIAIKCYGQTLEKLLDDLRKSEQLFDVKYLNYDVIVPTEKVILVLFNIVELVGQYHEKGKFVGCLKRINTIGIQDPSTRCCARKNYNDFEVTFWPEGITKEEIDVLPHEGMDKDWLAIGYILSKCILEDESEDDEGLVVAPEFKDLLRILNGGYHLSGYDPKVLNLIKTHCAFWDLGEKMYYYEKVWTRYENEQDNAVKEKIEEAMEKTLDKHFSRKKAPYPNCRTSNRRGDWRRVVENSKTPLGRIYRNQVCSGTIGKTNYFGSSGKELGRFTRIVYQHVREGKAVTEKKEVYKWKDKKKVVTRTDLIPKFEYKYFEDREIANAEPWYIEKQMIEMFPYMRCDLYASLHEAGICI